MVSNRPAISLMVGTQQGGGVSTPMVSLDVSTTHAGGTSVDPYEARYRAVYTAGGDRYYKPEPSLALVSFLDRTRLKPGRVVILGCGEGRNISPLVTRGWEVTGLDISPSAISRARKDYAPESGVQLICTNVVENIPDELTDTADLVLAIGFLHMITDVAHRHKIYANIMKILKKGGYLFLENNGSLNADTSVVLQGGKIEERTIQTVKGERKIPLERLTTIMLNGTTLREELAQGGLKVLEMTSGIFKHPDTVREQIVTVAVRP